ncbi:MAG: hypothetical protein KF841_01220 [Phycisphaerae bacterium]|nr:hypothetical protein [Phycisphaerae bacterium]
MADQRITTDPFANFWNEFMSRVGVDGSAANNGAGPVPAFTESSRQMQRIFFDTMAKYADDFMRSEQFLTAMKQTMDQSLQMKRLFDDFLVKAQRGMQAPVRADVDDIASLMRGIENRVLNRLDALEEKVAAVEESQRSGRGVKASLTKRPSVSATRAKRQAGGKGKR